VLVTVFGRVTSPVTPSLSESAARAAQQAFVVGQGRALLVAAVLLAGAAVLTAAVIRPRRRETAAGTEIPGVAPDLVEV
jgi:hypothetical protein